MTKRKLRKWSLPELKAIDKYIQDGLQEGKDIKELYKVTADTYGVTPNAINVRYGRYKRGQSIPKKSTNTVKEPTAGKRGPYKPRSKKASEDRRIVLPIKDVNLDLKKGTITIIY